MNGGPEDSPRIEDYALIGDMRTAALVSRHGSIDWFCVPRFDSGACFAALLGDADNGRWIIHPAGAVSKISRRYRGDTLVLETDFGTPTGRARLIDFMPPEARQPRIVRIVEGLEGRVAMDMEIAVRFDYGLRVPWAHRAGERVEFVAGPNALSLDFDVDVKGRAFTHVAAFEFCRVQHVSFVLSWHASHTSGPPQIDPLGSLSGAEAWWQEWSGICSYTGEWRDAIIRSLIVLKALTHKPTGGLVAAPTTSLPEVLGGVRNWDYRYCWLRDATFSLYALLMNGYTAEARSWRDWLLRAIAGQPELMQIMNGPAGESRLTELDLPWLKGFAGSRPVRIGNRAAQQFQLDVYGEVMAAMYLAARKGMPGNDSAWSLQKHLMESLEDRWTEPDEGIWEVRGPRRDFTHSKLMAWVAVDRAVRSVERFGLVGPVNTWKRLREDIRREILEKGYNVRREAFTWYYGSSSLDAALLMIPLVGFLPADDPRVLATVAAIQRDLVEDGFVRRYELEASTNVDGLPAGEGAFLPCTFWLADNLSLEGRSGEARALYERLLALRNDVGLLSEEYDPVRKIMLGNFPQAFTHVSLVNTAHNLTISAGLAHDRPPTL